MDKKKADGLSLAHYFVISAAPGGSTLLTLHFSDFFNFLIFILLFRYFVWFHFFLKSYSLEYILHMIFLV